MRPCSVFDWLNCSVLQTPSKCPQKVTHSSKDRRATLLLLSGGRRRARKAAQQRKNVLLGCSNAILLVLVDAYATKARADATDPEAQLTLQRSCVLHSAIEIARERNILHNGNLLCLMHASEKLRSQMASEGCTSRANVKVPQDCTKSL